MIPRAGLGRNNLLIGIEETVRKRLPVSIEEMPHDSPFPLITGEPEFPPLESQVVQS